MAATPSPPFRTRVWRAQSRPPPREKNSKTFFATPRRRRPIRGAATGTENARQPRKGMTPQGRHRQSGEGAAAARCPYETASGGGSEERVVPAPDLRAAGYSSIARRGESAGTWNVTRWFSLCFLSNVGGGVRGKNVLAYDAARGTLLYYDNPAAADTTTTTTTTKAPLSFCRSKHTGTTATSHALMPLPRTSHAFTPSSPPPHGQLESRCAAAAAINIPHRDVDGNPSL